MTEDIVTATINTWVFTATTWLNAQNSLVIFDIILYFAIYILVLYGVILHYIDKGNRMLTRIEAVEGRMIRREPTATTWKDFKKFPT